MKLITFISAGAFIVLSACAMQNGTAAQLNDLYANKWLLKKIHTETGMEAVSTKAFIKFDKEKGSAGGNGSCNNFGSNAAVNNNEVSFTNIFSTKMYCESVQKTEDAFLKQLALVNRFEIKDKILLLYRGTEVLLEFQAE
jgi:heat shock protein HslJ